MDSPSQPFIKPPQTPPPSRDVPDPLGSFLPKHPLRVTAMSATIWVASPGGCQEPSCAGLGPGACTVILVSALPCVKASW